MRTQQQSSSDTRSLKRVFTHASPPTILQRQNAEHDLSRSPYNNKPSTPQHFKHQVSTPPPATPSHDSAKRQKTTHNLHSNLSSPYQAPTTRKYATPLNQDQTQVTPLNEPSPHTLVSTCGSPTFRKICKQGDNAGRAFITCSCPRDGAFIWEDTWISKFHSKPDAVIKCKHFDAQKPGFDAQKPGFDAFAACNQLALGQDMLVECLNELSNSITELRCQLEASEARVQSLEKALNDAIGCESDQCMDEQMRHPDDEIDVESP